MSPFKSAKQRKWMHANKPEMAAEWEREELPRKRKQSKKSRKRRGKRR